MTTGSSHQAQPWVRLEKLPENKMSSRRPLLSEDSGLHTVSEDPVPVVVEPGAREELSLKTSSPR